MIKSIKVDHVSLAVKDIEKATSFFKAFLTVRQGPTSVWGEGPNAFTGRTLHLDGPNVEFLEGIDDGGFVSRYVAQRGEGPHHLTIQVEDLAAAKDHLDSLGIPTFGGNAEGKALFIHPRHSFGVLIQLIPAKEE